MKAELTLVWLHVTANLFWIGAIVAVAVVILADKGDAKLRGELAYKIYLHSAVPAFVVSFFAGAIRLMMDAGPYMKQPWMHAKLLFALIVIGLHHVIGARAKKLANGDADGPGPTKVLLIVLAVSAALAAFFAVQHIPESSTPPPASAAP
jgi:protoporphyrinogen IX oxidase